MIVTGFLGPPQRRRGESGKRCWWRCPLGKHTDENPSFAIDVGSHYWRCYGCGERGDAASLLMKLEGLSFREAVVALVEGGTLAVTPRPVREGSASPRPQPAPSQWSEEEAQAQLRESSARLWTSEGDSALRYLTGPERCLSPETIKRARLGWTPKAKGVAWTPPGILIPWFSGATLCLLKIRCLDSWRTTFPERRRPPKYLEAFRNSDLLVCYPEPGAIRPGRALIVVEGEFDAMLMSECLGNLAAVVTLGAASNRPTTSTLQRMLSASPWFVATDMDGAGESAASAWPSQAIRVRPPSPFKDWTDAKAGGVDLKRWWSSRLAGCENPSLFDWTELAAKRWGTETDDSPPGLINEGSPIDDLAAGFEDALKQDDPYTIEERRAIREESGMN